MIREIGLEPSDLPTYLWHLRQQVNRHPVGRVEVNPETVEDIITASVNPPPRSGAAGSSQSSAILLTAKATRSVKRDIRVGTFRDFPLQRSHSSDLT